MEQEGKADGHILHKPGPPENQCIGDVHSCTVYSLHYLV